MTSSAPPYVGLIPGGQPEPIGLVEVVLVGV
jgi:hypothetical protein